MRDIVFNHDGFGALAQLADTAMTEDDAASLLVRPLAQAGITAIDWSALSTAQHNCRTRHDLGYTAAYDDRLMAREVARVVQHYLAQPLDLLDIVVKHGHAAGLKVYAGLRLNHGQWQPLQRVPGRFQPGRENAKGHGGKKDFRDEAFHRYLLEVLEDLLGHGVDGIVLDFERKAPFFPPDAPIGERQESCLHFLRQVRRLTDRAVAVRVAHDGAIGPTQGQDPQAWLAEGLLDAIVPAVHNHEPDLLDWPVDRFHAAARQSPRSTRIWPQLWPTPGQWKDYPAVRHGDDALTERAKRLLDDGADGVYFFNFCCNWPGPRANVDYTPMFRSIKAIASAYRRQS